MPLLKFQTNTAATEEQISSLLKRGTDLIADELEKPLEYIQVIVEKEIPMAFGGSDKPAAFVELRSLGLPEDKLKTLSASICFILQDELAIPPGRIFVNFFDMERQNWGWNGSTFG